MRMRSGLWGALLLTGALVLSGCGLKYDLYLPEDETNPQNQSAASASASVSASEADPALSSATATNEQSGEL